MLFTGTFPFSMAATSYEAAYSKYYGDRLKGISHQTTEEEIKDVYDKWANEYEKVTSFNNFKLMKSRYESLQSNL